MHDSVMLRSSDGPFTGENRPNNGNWNDGRLNPYDAQDGDYLLASKESAQSRLSDPEAIRLRKLKGELHAKADKIAEDKLDLRNSEEEMNLEERS